MSSNPARPPSHLPDHLAGYANELAAAQNRLGASADDLAACLISSFKHQPRAINSAIFLKNHGALSNPFESF